MASDKAYFEQRIDRALEIAVSIDKAYRVAAFQEVLHSLLTDRPAVTPAEQAPSRPTGIPSLLNEFMAVLKPKSHVERVVGHLYFALHSEGQDKLSAQDSLEGYSKSRTPKPGNLHDVIARCQRAGLLVDAPGPKRPKAWQITPRGEQHIVRILGQP